MSKHVLSGNLILVSIILLCSATFYEIGPWNCSLCCQIDEVLFYSGNFLILIPLLYSMTLLSLFLLFFYRAEIFRQRGDVTMAIMNYSQTIKLDRNDHEAYYKRAEMYEKVRRFCPVLFPPQQTLKHGPNFIELFKQKTLLGNSLLSRNKQGTSHNWYMWHGIHAGSLIRVSIIVFCFYSVFLCLRNSMKLGPARIPLETIHFCIITKWPDIANIVHSFNQILSVKM